MSKMANMAMSQQTQDMEIGDSEDSDSEESASSPSSGYSQQLSGTGSALPAGGHSEAAWPGYSGGGCPQPDLGNGGGHQGSGGHPGVKFENHHHHHSIGGLIGTGY